MPKALLLDADALCLSVYRAALRSAGFSSISETRGSQAVSQCEAHPDLCVVVVDLSLACGESGVSAAKEIRRRRPDLPVLFVSGWPFEQAISMGLIAPAEWPEDHTAFLEKPFTFQVFVGAVVALVTGGGISLAAAAETIG